MFKAELYSVSNPMQVKDARYVMSKYGNHLQYDEGERILDIGCGPGGVTDSVLVPALPKSAVIVGCDISDTMVAFANAKYGKDNLSFKRLNIEEPLAWKDWENEPFCKIFSFYCLHWIQDQRTAAENMYGLLKDNGEILVALLAQSPIYILYEELSKIPKWKAFMKDVKRYISTYFYLQSPGEAFATILRKANFKNVWSVVEDLTFEYPTKHSLMRAIEAVNPFLDHIPESHHTEFANEIVRIVEEKNLAKCLDNGTLQVNYKLIVASARK